MKIAYETHNFRSDTLDIISQVSDIVVEYDAQGFNLTLRQLYYQFVARGWLANTDKNYKKLGSIVSNGRLAGMISWAAIEDRLRSPESLSHWGSPIDILRSAARSYQIDTRGTQDCRIEVWIEKDALSEVAAKAAEAWDVTWFACRGYVSQSAMWEAAQRFERDGRPVVLLHLGDHDPSGIDMTRDIDERLNNTFGLADHMGVDVRRIALNMDQVETHRPPPNPTKLKDSRAAEYVAKFGRESWELDAMDPAYLVNLIEDEIACFTDMDALEEQREEMEEDRKKLERLARNWS